jgi:signal transduction histidine kinase/CheY-like chemotaxis protein
MQKALILFLMYTNAALPTIRLALISAGSLLEREVESSNLVGHILTISVHLAIILLYNYGFLSLQVIGVICSELSINILMVLGYIIEPHINLAWLMGTLYLAFFVQGNLIASQVLRGICYFKPLVFVLIFGLTSGQIQLKDTNDLFVVIVLLWLGVIVVISILASEEAKTNLMKKLSEEKQQLISAVPVGLVVLTSEEQFIMPNAACLTHLDCLDSQQVKSKIEELTYRAGTAVYNPSSNSLAQDIKDYLGSSSTASVDFGQTELNHRTLCWRGQKLLWNDLPAAVIVNTDITEELQHELTKMESQFKNVMLRSVSHELKTPTNGIYHLVKAVLLGEDTPSWAKSKLQVALVCSEHLLMLISDLLDFSQLLSGAFSLSLTEFSLRKVLDDCVNLISLTADLKKVKLLRHFDPLLPEVALSDPNRLSQVLLNLLSNAVKFTPALGCIDVKAELTEEGQLEVSVTDSGIGIAPEDIPRLFSSFGRIASSGSMNPQGVGLGLHISNMLAQQLGGSSISVQSQVSQGSCFSFKVHIREDLSRVEMTYSETSYTAAEDLNSIQNVYVSEVWKSAYPPVLIVDDTEINRMVIVNILAQIKVECVEAENGAKAIDYIVKRAQAGKPLRVVVMDFEMPGMDGPTTSRTVLARLRELALPLPSIIAHTAYTTERDIGLCREAGMIDFLAKPSPCDLVCSMISKYLALSVD